jgi:hypothetical protein
MEMFIATLAVTFFTLELMFAVELVKEIKNDWAVVSQRKVFA